MKPSKFLLCDNPIMNAQYDGRSFILHSQNPIIIAEIFSFKNLTENEILKYQSEIPIGSKLNYGIETFFFVPIYIQDGWKIKNNAQFIADELAKIFRRMADWYQAYLTWEDNHD
jgi:hypothetical protein